jgi:hypothetical protein
MCSSPNTLTDGVPKCQKCTLRASGTFITPSNRNLAARSACESVSPFLWKFSVLDADSLR